jgi:hypothetical protein
MHLNYRFLISTTGFTCVLFWSYPFAQASFRFFLSFFSFFTTDGTMESFLLPCLQFSAVIINYTVLSIMVNVKNRQPVLELDFGVKFGDLFS